MPIHTIAEHLSGVDSKKLTTAVAVAIGAFAVKVYSGGKKSVWEREWGGKLIIIAVSSMYLSELTCRRRPSRQRSPSCTSYCTFPRRRRSFTFLRSPARSRSRS